MTEDSEDLVGPKGAEPICRSCGSAKVMRDAWAELNPVKDLWELGQVFDDGYRAECEQSSKFALGVHSGSQDAVISSSARQAYRAAS